jgi:hypothetical protein
LLAKLHIWDSPHSSEVPPPPAHEISERERERLEALGYAF